MIELIFAIVIIGIAVSAIPTVITISSHNQKDAMVSEGIFALSALMMQDSTYYWDQNSSNSGALANVLDIQNCATSADCNNNSMRVGSTIYRVGHTNETASTTHRHFHITNPTYATAVAANESVETRIVGVQTDLITGGSAAGYKKSFKYIMNVTYVKDDTFSTTTVSSDTNVKMMEYKLYMMQDDGSYPADSEPTAVMRNFVCNIGEADYSKRSF